MTRTQYAIFNEINDLQTEIMVFVEYWVHEKKTPIPRQEIVAKMVEKGHHNFTVMNAIESLVRKQYIRKAYTSTNKTSYVQLRKI
jgi:hypothetical protein